MLLKVLSQKATDDAKRGPRKHPPASTATNGHSQNGGGHMEVPHILSQISEDQSDAQPDPDEVEMVDTKANSDNSSEIDVSKETSSSSCKCKCLYIELGIIMPGLLC